MQRRPPIGRQDRNAIGLKRLPAPLLAALLGVLIGPLDVGFVGVALPRITEALGAEIGVGQLVVLAYVVPLALAYVPAGMLADRASPTLVLRAGLLLFAIGSLTVAIAPQLGGVVLGRGIQGIGAAAAVTAGQVVAFGALGAARAGRGLGLVHVAVAVGMLGGPLVGGLLLERVEWRGVFLAEIPVALAGLAIARPFPSSPKLGSTLRVTELVRRASLLRPLGLALLVFIAMSSNMFLMPFLLQRPFALGPSTAGLFLAVVPLAILAGAVPGGDLADRHGSRWPSVAGAALMAAGIIAFALATYTQVLAALAVALLVYGAGAALFQAPNNRAVLGAAPPDGVGLASGLLGASRQAGQALGVLVAGGLVAAGGGVDSVSSYVSAFVVLAGLAGCAGVLALWGKDRPATAVRVQAGPWR